MVESNGHDRSEAPRRRRARIPWVSDSGLGYAPGIRVDKNNALYACVHRPRKRERQREREGRRERERKGETGLLFVTRGLREHGNRMVLTCPRGDGALRSSDFVDNLEGDFCIGNRRIVCFYPWWNFGKEGRVNEFRCIFNLSNFNFRHGFMN